MSGLRFGNRHEINSSYHNGVERQRQEGFARAAIGTYGIPCHEKGNILAKRFVKVYRL
jgi:hypothetical protein